MNNLVSFFSLSGILFVMKYPVCDFEHRSTRPFKLCITVISGQMLLPSSVILILINLHKYWLFYLYMCVLSGSSLSQDAANKPPGDTDDSISDGQRVVIDPSL